VTEAVTSKEQEKIETGNSKLEIGNAKLEIGYAKVKAASPKFEIGNSKIASIFPPRVSFNFQVRISSFAFPISSFVLSPLITPLPCRRVDIRKNRFSSRDLPLAKMLKIGQNHGFLARE